MSTRRIKLKGTAVYHCMSRVVSGDRRLDRHEKEVLRKMMRMAAEFSGVEVLAYCLMNNHFHLLVRVPEKVPLSRDEVMRRYAVLYETSNSPEYPDAAGMRLILEGDDDALAEAWMERLQARMGDISEYLRTLKQRFSIWYNKTHEHFGAVWSERFKSVVVENCPDALKTVAAYLDLNPVRAGLVEDPADYRWCSYAEAMGGDKVCGLGLAQVVGCETWKDAVATYRVVLFGKGGVARRSDQATIPAERVREVLRAGGKVELCELLRCRVRFFSAGGILGSEAFVRATGTAWLNRLKRDGEAGVAGSGGGGGLSQTAADLGKNAKRLGRLCLASGLKLSAWRDLQLDPVRAPSELEQK